MSFLSSCDRNWMKIRPSTQFLSIARWSARNALFRRENSPTNISTALANCMSKWKTTSKLKSCAEDVTKMQNIQSGNPLSLLPKSSFWTIVRRSWQARSEWMLWSSSKYSIRALSTSQSYASITMEIKRVKAITSPTMSKLTKYMTKVELENWGRRIFVFVW